MPVAHLVLEDLLLLSLEGLADALPAAADGTSDIANATLFRQPAGDILVRVALLLEVDNAGVIGVVVGLDWLWPGGLASGDTNVAVVSELVAYMRLVLRRALVLAECAKPSLREEAGGCITYIAGSTALSEVGAVRGAIGWVCCSNALAIACMRDRARLQAQPQDGGLVPLSLVVPWKHSFSVAVDENMVAVFGCGWWSLDGVVGCWW